MIHSVHTTSKRLTLCLPVALFACLTTTPLLAKPKAEVTAKATADAPKAKSEKAETPAEDPLAEPASDEADTEGASLESEEKAEEEVIEPEGPICVTPGRKWSFFFDGGFRWDTGNSSRRSQVGDDITNQNDNITALGPMFHLGLMHRKNPHFRMGGALGYGANHDLNNNNLLIGQLLTVDYRLEWSAPLAPDLSIVGAPRVGVSLVLPSGVLADRISQYQSAGYDTWSGPRYGFLLGLDAGVRYQMSSWLSLRATVGYAWGMHFLLDSKAEGETVSASHSWQIQASRLSGNLGLEIAF
jgi:hypothetical protein